MTNNMITFLDLFFILIDYSLVSPNNYRFLNYKEINTWTNTQTCIIVWVYGGVKWLTNLSSELALNKAKLLIPGPWAKGSLVGHPYMENHTHTNMQDSQLSLSPLFFLWARWKVCFISHTVCGGVCLLKMLCKPWLTLMCSDRIAERRWLKQRAGDEACQSGESSKKTKTKTHLRKKEKSPVLLKRLAHSWD